MTARRGQLAAQVFIYILGIIVVGAILLIGMRALTVLNTNRCEAQETQFATALASAIQKNKKYGVSATERFTLPCDAQQVCFVSRSVVDQYPNNVNTEADLSLLLPNPLIVSNIVGGDNTNVYLLLSDGTFQGVERFSVPAPIDLPETSPYRCIGSDPLTIRFKGAGQLVEVEATA